MQENTNKAIAFNSIVLYSKLILTTVFGLFTTRFALRALGVVDFGLFSVLGSIISFIGVFNVIMLSTSNRFISVAIGRGDVDEINEQFNINLSLHFLLALATFIIAFFVGEWYIHNHLNYEGDIVKAVWVFRFSILGSFIAFIGVPYNGLLMAKEKFVVFCGAELLSSFLKMLVAFMLLYFFNEKLLIYAFSQAGLTILTTLLFVGYCRRHYYELTKLRIVYNKERYKEVLSFSGWVAYGAIATVGRNQGATILVNAFFNTAMNAALGLANTVHSFVSMFANSVSQPMAPQITKSYSVGNKSRCDTLLVMSTKYTFLVMLFVSAPFLVDSPWIFKLWLGNVPQYAVEFTTLIIVDTLIGALNSGISSVIFASGRIKLYQISINSVRLVSIVVAYFVLKSGVPASALFYTYIVFSSILFFIAQLVLHHTLKYDNSVLIRKSYIPSLLVVVLFLPYCLVRLPFPPVIRIAVGEILLAIIIFTVALSKEERNIVKSFLKKFIKKIN